jgi:hypothetical protein
LNITSGSKERRRRDGKPFLQENNSMQDSVGNEDSDLNKAMINVIKEPSDAHKKTSKQNSEKFMERLSDLVN